MHLVHIYIYPIKSMAGIRLEEAAVQREGLQYDRRWMLLNREGNFLTQRELPGMALIQCSIGGQGLRLSHRSGQGGTVELPFDAEGGAPPMAVRVWDDEVAAQPVGGPVDEWLGDMLKTSCQLVKIEDNALRYNLKGKPGKYVSFADSQPFLIVGAASLYDLNSRLEKPVPMNRFRPNFVFDGGAPFVEDTWDNFRIGQLAFKNMGPCPRCTVTTIDQLTGRRTGAEPLRTLHAFRKQGNEVNFGMRAAWFGQGENAIVRVGDPVSGNETAAT